MFYKERQMENKNTLLAEVTRTVKRPCPLCTYLIGRVCGEGCFHLLELQFVGVQLLFRHFLQQF